MTSDDLESYARDLGYTVDVVTAANGEAFTVIRGVHVVGGSKDGAICDVAFLRCTTEPFAMPPAIHTRPPLVTKGTLNTQDSALGTEWAYWSRRYDRPPTPRAILAHIFTVLAEV